MTAARAADGTGGSANVQTYAVALDGDDFTAEARADLHGVLGDERYLYEGSLTELEARFRELAGRIAEQAEHTCTVVRDGTARCSGSNRYGQRGDGGASSEERLPIVAGGPRGGAARGSPGRLDSVAPSGPCRGSCSPRSCSRSGPLRSPRRRRPPRP